MDLVTTIGRDRWDPDCVPIGPTRRPFSVADLRDAPPKIVVVSYDVGLTCLGCATVSLRKASLDLSRSRLPYIDPWAFMTDHAACDFAETINLLREGGSRAKSAKSVAATTYGEYFEHALLARRIDLLLVAADDDGPDGCPDRARARPPHVVVVESQKGLATSLVRQAYANFHRHLATFYNTLWRCRAQDVVPLLHKDSGAGKGIMARAVFEAEPSRFLDWMRRECDERDVLVWLAYEAHPRLELQDAIVDAAVKRFDAHHEYDEMIAVFRKSPVLKAYARSRIARDGGSHWLRPAAGRAPRSSDGALDFQSPGQLAASLFDDGKAEVAGGADDSRVDGFLDYESELDVDRGDDPDRELQQSGPKKARVAFGGVRSAIAASKATGRSSQRCGARGARGARGHGLSKGRAERREYNKVVVLCACETLFEVCPPGAPWFRTHWVALRSASRATERDKRRDMADAVLQGMFNLWMCVSPKVDASSKRAPPKSVSDG